MGAAADARRSEIERAGLRFRARYQLFYRIDACLFTDNQYVRLAGKRRDGHEIFQRAVREVRSKRRAYDMSTAVRQQRVSVRRGLRYQPGSDSAALSGAVVHHDRLIHASDSFGATMRAMESTPLPAAVAITMRTGLVGYTSADAV